MTNKNWKVEVRDNCKICGGDLPNARFRSYCSEECRNKRNNAKQAESGYATKWNRDKRNKIASTPDPENKCQCLVCGLWYVQVCSHVYSVHGLKGREYREFFKLEVKRGITPEWYRKLKGGQAIDNGTWENLIAGAKFRFKKGDKAGDYERSPITIERLKKQISKTHKKKLSTARPQ